MRGGAAMALAALTVVGVDLVALAGLVAAVVLPRRTGPSRNRPSKGAVAARLVLLVAVLALVVSNSASGASSRVTYAQAVGYDFRFFTPITVSLVLVAAWSLWALGKPVTADGTRAAPRMRAGPAFWAVFALILGVGGIAAFAWGGPTP